MCVSIRKHDKFAKCIGIEVGRAGKAALDIFLWCAI